MEASSTKILPIVCNIKFAKVSQKILSRLLQCKGQSYQKIHGVVGDGSTQKLWFKTSQLTVINFKQATFPGTDQKRKKIFYCIIKTRVAVKVVY